MVDAAAEGNFTAFREIMTTAGLPPVVINTFRYYYRQLHAGKTGSIPETELLPVAALPDADDLDWSAPAKGKAALPGTVMIKLNGGLGTSMQLESAKSLIEVKSGLNFLDIIARQAIDRKVPLLFMNSFATRKDTLAVLAGYPALAKYGIGLDFVQHKVPKISQHDMQPVSLPHAPHLEWYPPGHGDIYTALVTNGTLDLLLAKGYRYAFISNADNLGATLDENILGFMVQEDCQFLMEVTDRTESDRKGGHLARTRNGRYMLRESAQCPERDLIAFQDIHRHRYFNTNNLWLDLEALQDIMTSRDNILGLPLICNRKTADPGDEKSPPVYQLETAMGAAISVFDRASAIRVPRSRFAPVKTTNDLFIVRSDVYELTDRFQLVPNRSRTGGWPRVELDSRYFQALTDFEERLPDGVPSLLSCSELTVIGDVKFGRGVVLAGSVRIVNHHDRQELIEPCTTLTGEVLF